LAFNVNASLNASPTAVGSLRVCPAPDIAYIPTNTDLCLPLNGGYLSTTRRHGLPILQPISKTPISITDAWRTQMARY